MSETLDTPVRSAQPAAELRALVDLRHYPLHALDTPAGEDLIRRCRAQLADDGCVVLKRFVPLEAVARLEAETERLSPRAHFNQTHTNPFNSDGDPSLPPEHPVNRFEERTNGFVAGDCIDQNTIVRQIYHSHAFQHFIARVVGEQALHEYADPLAGLVVNVLREGCQHPWHYDTNEYIVTLMTRKPEDGGEFQYAPGLRNPEDENLDGVQRLLDGDHGGLRTLALEPGDLQVFFGRYSLHRVAKVKGSRERHTVIFAYAREPGFVGRPERAQKIFGRMAPIHEQMLRDGVTRSDKLAD